MPVRVGELVEKARFVSADTSMARIRAILAKVPDCDWLTVVKDRKPVGLVDRLTLLDLINGTDEATLTKLTLGDVAGRKPLFVEASVPVHAFLKRFSTHPEAAWQQGILVTDKKSLAGVLNLRNLLSRFSDIFSDHEATIPKPDPKPVPTTPPLLGTIAHEIRTPLTGMMGLAEMLSTRMRDKENREIAETIVRSGETLDRILTDALDYVSLEAGKLILRQEACDLTDLVEDLRRIWAYESARRGLSFRVSFIPDGPHRIITDPGRLRQIANNLVSNALKFTRHGGVNVCFSTQTLGSQLILSLEVSDTGRGLSEAEHERFRTAFEADEARDGSKSWGLGLTISHALTRHLGGRLGHADNPGGGSIFTLLTPVERALSEAKTWAPPSASKNGKFELGDVLLVEDHEASAMIVIDALEEAGWIVHHAGSLQAAELYSTKASYQAVICDLHLPDGNAMSFIDGLRRRGGLNATTPILVMTADISENRREACLSIGADQAVRKPISGPDLVATLADLVMSRSQGAITMPILRGRLAS